MRLLEMKSPGEFSLIQVATHNTLSYAILSHTWTYGQEVTYQDLISGAGKSKSGYNKIKFCGEQATKDGLQYFWVDTCCIDKSNAVELATAINSMFRWYRNATKCYVYLADVSTPSHHTDVQAKQSTWEATFRDSRWFTRGWTLQELIAPTVVEFFSKERKLLGDKRSLEKLIHGITKIPFQALRGNSLSDFSIEERKGWAAQRYTTEEEDIVYCLLGLCEVSMLPNYGEGKGAALRRLQMTFREFSQDNTELKDSEDDSAPFIVPFSRNIQFTGRVMELAELEERLFVREQPSKIAITGLGGVGKTQLVLELAYRTRARYQSCSVLWIPAADLESLQQAYFEIAQQLNIAGSDDKTADIKKLVQLYLSKTTSRWLLIFDNADSIDMWNRPLEPERGSSRLIDYLPRSPQGCIVFTTRDKKIAVKLAQQNVIEVPEMSEEVATQLLQKRLVNPKLVDSIQDTKALLKELTYLPLALVQAAAYINENGIEFADYLWLLAEQEEDVIALLSEEFEDDNRYCKNPVATTWLISFEQIRYRDPLAADYLSFMACVDSMNIPLSLLPAGVSRKKEIEAIGTLNAYSFIIKQSAASALDLHRLVYLATRNWLRQKDLIAQWTERAIIRLEEVFPDHHNHSNRSLWRIHLPHVLYVLKSNVIDKDKKWLDLVQKSTMCLYNDGRYNEAEVLLSESSKWHKRVAGLEHPDTLTSIGNLASIMWSRGRWKEAGDLDVHVVETRKRVLGLEHPDTLLSIANLASTYRNQGRWKEAEHLEVQVMETSKRVLGLEHPDTLLSIANLASTYRNQGRWKEAEDLEVQVMETSKRVLGLEHPDTLRRQANLASTMWIQGRWKEAEHLQVEVAETRKRVLGLEHPDTLIITANLASTYRNQGHWKEAEDLHMQVMETSKRVLGPEHPNTLTSIANLASTMWSQGRWKEAEHLQVEVAETRKRVLGLEHPDTLMSIANLASTYQSQGRWEEAEDLEVQVMETRKRVLGLEHPDTLISINNLAFTWKGHGRDLEALKLMEGCVEVRTRVLGTNHPDTLSSSVALLQWQTGNSKLVI